LRDQNERRERKLNIARGVVLKNKNLDFEFWFWFWFCVQLNGVDETKELWAGIEEVKCERRHGYRLG
jgi:hypothetical protein